MDWTEALDLVVSRTKHERYRQLCAHSHPDHELHRQQILALAGHPVEQTTITPEFLSDLDQVRACPHRQLQPGAGCCAGQVARCSRPDRGWLVELPDCLDCVRMGREN